VNPNTPGALRLRAEKAEARVAELEGQIATMKFNAAATPKHQPAPEPHPWDQQ